MALAAAALLLIAAAQARDPAPAPARGGGLNLDLVGSFTQPVYTDNAPGSPKLLFVVEKAGTVEVLRRENNLPGHFLNITEHVRTSGNEQGLLGIAFPPSHERTRRFYVYYTDNDGDYRVDEFKRSRRHPARAREGTRRRVISFDHPNNAQNHNGGTIAFGPDGKLWLAPGDGGSTPGAAQDPNSLRGKLLRIIPTKRRAGAPGHRSPRGNPFVGEPGLNEIWSLGLRNPFRFSFDAKRNTVAIGDVGLNTREEINFLKIGKARRANFGWPRYEGNFSHGGPLGPGTLRFPMHDYPHGPGGAAVTGGVVVRDPDLPQLRGRYLFADFYDGDIFRFRPDLANNDADNLVDTGLNVSFLAAFTIGAHRRVYITSLNGPVYRLRSG